MPDPLGEVANLTRMLRRLPAEAQALWTVFNAGLIGPDRLRLSRQGDSKGRGQDPVTKFHLFFPL